MRLNFITWLVTLGFTISLFACSDHRLGGSLSPVQLRLKSIQRGSLTTTYAYDSQNRLSSISNSDGGLAVVAYGDPDKKYVTTDAEAAKTYFVSFTSASNQAKGNGNITPYPLVLDGASFLAIQYNLVNSKIAYSPRIRDYSYTFDATKHLSVFSDYNDSSGPDLNTFEYSYTSENITTEKFSMAAGHGDVGTNTYVYDDKINPFFGLFDTSIEVVQRFSRHNVLSSVYVSNRGSATITSTYEYEYNQQGLPTKRTKKQAGSVVEVLSYSYEPY